MEACHLTLCFWGVGVYVVGDVLNYAFFASRLQSTGLQTKLLRQARIVPFGLTFDDALCGSVLRFGIDYERSSPLTHTGMADFMLGRVVIDAAQHKRVKYEVGISAGKEVDIGLDEGRDKPLCPFEISLLKRIQKFSMTQDIGARVVVHIFNRTSFAIAKGVRAGTGYFTKGQKRSQTGQNREQNWIEREKPKPKVQKD
ncbi:hypothetical protein Tco_0422531 [Tanacetum coccineum]